MPAFLEKELKAEYGAKSDIPYKIMNSRGYMHGNKVTAKGRAAEAKHKADMKRKKKRPRGGAHEQAAALRG